MPGRCYHNLAIELKFRIKASRKKRIAAGAGVEVHEVNKLLKQYEQMSTMMKKMGRMGGMPSMAMLKNFPFGNMLGGGMGKFPFK